MKAIQVTQFGDESDLHYASVEKPTPGKGEICVRLHAIGVNPVETYIRAGKYFPLPPLPYIPGNDGAGIVEKIGPTVTGLAVGDRVFICATLSKQNTGTYAEYVVCDASAAQPLPPTTSFEEGAGLGTAAMAAAYALFTRAALRAGEIVLVNGATGGVGSIAVQLARRAGAIVYGTAGDPAGIELVKSLGAHAVFNHHDSDYMDRIAKESGNGPDVIIEMLANENLTKDLAILATHGRIVIVGSRGSLEFAPRDAMMKDASILGIMLTNMRQEDFHANMCIISAGLETGMKVIIAEKLPLEDAAKAHQLVMHGKQHGKVLLLPD